MRLQLPDEVVGLGGSDAPLAEENDRVVRFRLRDPVGLLELFRRESESLFQLGHRDVGRVRNLADKSNASNSGSQVRRKVSCDEKGFRHS